MTPDELYKTLDQAGADYEVVEIFEGVRLLSIVVHEQEDEQYESIE